MNRVSSSLLYGKLNAKSFRKTLNKRQFDKKFKSNSAFFTLTESISYLGSWNFDRLVYLCAISCITFPKLCLTFPKCYTQHYAKIYKPFKIPATDIRETFY